MAVMKTVLGIFRAACFSPGMVERDEAILRAVMTRLQAQGFMTSLIHEEELTAHTPMPDIVLHMTRSSEALAILEKWQNAGCHVLNSVEGIRSVERAALAQLCAQQGIPTPTTWIVSTASAHTLVAKNTEGVPCEITFPCWIKRTGSCAQQAEDICRASDIIEYRNRLTQFHTRGITEVVVMEHLEGTVIKFYAVKSAGFSYFVPSTSLGYDKFSTTPSNASTNGLEWKTESLNQLLSTINCQLEIFGGDAIVGHDGIARLIDLNDWPSFSACRETAAEAIIHIIKNFQSQKEENASARHHEENRAALNIFLTK